MLRSRYRIFEADYPYFLTGTVNGWLPVFTRPETVSHPQQIANEKMMQQKLEYIHLNPVKRGYVDDSCHWRYSSARNDMGQPGVMDVVTDW